MNNLLSYCGLTDARMRASEKDLPVLDKAKLVHLKGKTLQVLKISLIAGIAITPSKTTRRGSPKTEM